MPSPSSSSGAWIAIDTSAQPRNAAAHGSAGASSGGRRRSRMSITQPSTASAVNRWRNGTRWSSGMNSCGLARMKTTRQAMPGTANIQVQT